MYGTAQVTDGGSVDARAARSPPYARLALWGGCWPTATPPPPVTREGVSHDACFGGAASAGGRR